MNKKLVAVAVAGVLAAPLAAQAQTANVTLYGRLNLSAEVVNVEQSNGTKGNFYQVSSNSSRLGVRGTESLGGGLNAIFQIESNVNGDTGGGVLATRETFVGLQGGWGTFKIGNFLAPYDDIHPIFGNVPTLTTSILSSASIWANNGGQSKTSGSFDDRLKNSVRYDTPKLGGFTAGTQISQLDSSAGQGGITYGDVNTQRRHAYVWSTGGYYNNGPIQAGLAYEMNKEVRGSNLDDYGVSLAGAYNFGVWRLAGVWERIKYDTPTGDVHRDFFGVSGTFNLGPGQVYALFGLANDGKGSACDINDAVNCSRTLGAVGGVARGSDTGARQWSLSYTYPLSKRTLTYVGYMDLKNDNNAAYNLFGSQPAGVPASGYHPKGFALGIVHFF